MRWFSRLLDILYPPRDAALVAREATLELLGTRIAPRALCAGSITLLPYRDPLVRALVREAKFKDNRDAQRLLGRALGEYLADWYAEETALMPGAPLVIVPVPLSRVRLRERGYNQAERIARAALPAVRHAILAPELLRRTRDTLPQTSLGRRERHDNVHGAFETTDPPDLGALYVVVDDVITTGATLAAAVDALAAAGASRIYGLALAHQSKNDTLKPVGDVAEWSKVPHC